LSKQFQLRLVQTAAADGRNETLQADYPWDAFACHRADCSCRLPPDSDIGEAIGFALE
jgi:cytolysin (calcineurin-like family phosphatase)